MLGYSIDIAEFLKKGASLPVIDVRSPAEYSHAHIPLAINLPLLRNEERSEIGNLYFKKGSSEAVMQGLKFIGPRMAALAAEGHRIAPEGEVLIHCWRGGMRSNSMAWLFNTAGIETYTLEGGYKNYRHYVQEFFSTAFNLFVIGGMTGSGKTAVLEALESRGIQIVHLERLACHRGSVFGGIGQPGQPSSEQFENDLFSVLRQLDRNKPVFVEDESLAIGKVFIPRPFYEQMNSAGFIRLVMPMERRVKSLVEDYTGGVPELLIQSVKRIEKRLGLEHAARIIEHISNHEMAEAVIMILKYYDKIYTRSMAKHDRNENLMISITNEDADSIADLILNFIIPKA
jgi:tRNA 2-selenouridine synthase